MVRCAATKCSHGSGEGYNLFVFPKDSTRRATWQINSGLTNLDGDKRLCQSHFTQEQFKIINGSLSKKLKNDAVPTIFSLSDPWSNTKTTTAHGSDHTYSKKPTEELQAEQIRFLMSQLKGKDEALAREKKKVKRLQRDCDKSRKMLKSLFEEDQIKCLERSLEGKDMRGFKYSARSVQKSLKVKYSCRARGYKHLRQSGYPLPSLRTLRRRVEGITFIPGVLSDVLLLLKGKVSSMREMDKNVILLLDEMTIQESLEYNKGTDELVGNVTLPHHTGSATHALVFYICGLSRRWKQTVAYHFTGASTKGLQLLDIILDITKKCHEIGLLVRCVGSDMGTNNQRFWNLLKIKGKRSEEPVTSIDHPCMKGEKLFLTPDAPHLLKNMRNPLTNGHDIKFSRKTVEKYNLPTDTVNVSYIRQMMEIDKQNRTGKRMAHNLTEKHINPSHKEKMRVNLAKQLFSKPVAAAIYLLVEQKRLPKDAITTAWFIDYIEKWYYFMTNRKCKFSYRNPGKYKEAINFLKGFMVVIKGMKIQGGQWKPVQRGMIIATQTMLELTNHLLRNCGFTFFVPGRLTSDAIENLFSIIRSVRIKPTAAQFTPTLKETTVSQVLTPIKTGNYEIDDTDDQVKLDFLSGKKKKGDNHTEKPILLDYEDAELYPGYVNQNASNEAIEENVFHTECGYMVRKINKKLNCERCKDVLCVSEPCIPQHRFTQLKEFRDDELNLLYIAPNIFTLFQECEKVFMEREPHFSKCREICKSLKTLCNAAVKDLHCDPDCHPLTNILCDRFVNTRIEMYVKGRKLSIKQSEAKKLAATMGTSGD